MTSPMLGPMLAPILTPFSAKGEPDAVRYSNHARWLMRHGCTGLVPFGTTGEGTSLGIDERRLLLISLLAAGLPPERLMPGTGLCATSDTAELTRFAVEVGCAAVLMLPPFYYKNVGPNGIFSYFAEVIERVASDELRIFLYNIPPISGVGFTLDLVERLARDFPRTIAGLKDSSGNWQFTESLIQALPGFQVYSGSEAMLLANLRAGGAGCISASANLVASRLGEITQRPSSTEAEHRQLAVTAIRRELEARPIIPALKALLAHYRGDEQWRAVRPPLEAMPEEMAIPLIKTLAETHEFAPEIT
jgi:4-hydroxy-tetrahydrodipicolinate synthase